MEDDNLIFIYIIQKGDTFWDLENKLGLSHGTLQKLNSKLDPKKLQIGSTIIVLIPRKKIKPCYINQPIYKNKPLGFASKVGNVKPNSNSISKSTKNSYNGLGIFEYTDETISGIAAYR